MFLWSLIENRKLHGYIICIISKLVVILQREVHAEVREVGIMVCRRRVVKPKQSLYSSRLRALRYIIKGVY